MLKKIGSLMLGCILLFSCAYHNIWVKAESVQLPNIIVTNALDIGRNHVVINGEVCTDRDYLTKFIYKEEGNSRKCN